MPATSTLQICRSDASAASGVTGTFAQTGGTATVGILRMGGSNTTPANNANAIASLNLSAGTFAATTFAALSGADSSSSTINIGGTADVTLPAFPTARGAGSTATINFNGGTLKPLAASATYMGGLTAAYIKAGGAKFDTTNGSITITQSLLTDTLSTGGGLSKDGGNTLTLTGANTYTGSTVVNAGALVLADDAQLTFVLGASSGSNNSISGAGGVTLDGDFVIDTSAADALATGTWTLENVPSLTGAYSATFSVVGFTDAGGDKWTKPNGPTKIYTFDETTGVLTLGPAGYASWSGGAAFDADANSDGVDNGMAWVLGAADPSANAIGLLPTFDNTTDPTYFIYTYRRSDSANTDPNVTLTMQYGSDLAGWTTAVHDGSNVIITPTDNFYGTSPGVDKVEVKIKRTLAVGGKLFGRLNSVKAP